MFDKYAYLHVFVSVFMDYNLEGICRGRAEDIPNEQSRHAGVDPVGGFFVRAGVGCDGSVGLIESRPETGDAYVLRESQEIK